MQIGSEFNKRCEKILKAAGRESDFKSGKQISVEKLAEILHMDRVEIRNLFRYMIDLQLIKSESIGGPALYGHISLTEKGILKLKSLMKDSDS
jgi:DNA-binding GntR family transcriptional regulator